MKALFMLWLAGVKCASIKLFLLTVQGLTLLCHSQQALITFELAEWLNGGHDTTTIANMTVKRLLLE